MAMRHEPVAVDMKGVDVIGQGEGRVLGLVKYTRGLGRKRIVISNDAEERSADLAIRAPLKRQCSARMDSGCEKSPLESLPHDILVKILCGVNHEDLEQLYHVSKLIKEAALSAKTWHFAYSTPKKTPAFRTFLEFNESTDLDEIEAPNAPRRPRYYRSRLAGKDISSLQGALFT